MLMRRVIPCLLLKGGGFYKTVRFDDPRYVGDPINTVRLFNDKEVDELIVLDIGAGRRRSPIAYDLLADLASEAFMPICYGGGITTVEEAGRVLELGIEKVSVNTAAIEAPETIEGIASIFGSQSVVVGIDYRRRSRKQLVHARGGELPTALNPIEHAKSVVERGAGEILLTSIDREGTGTGYDVEMLSEVAGHIDIPVVAHGGASTVADLRSGLDAGASAVAAGSMFVFQGRHRAVLINYPSPEQRRGILAT